MSKLYSNRAIVLVLIAACFSVFFAVRQFFALRDMVYNETLQQALIVK